MALTLKNVVMNVTQTPTRFQKRFVIALDAY